MTATKRPRWLTRNVRTLSAVSFFQDAASELLYPIMPIFLTVVLGAPAAVVGAVEGVAEGVASLTKLAAGRLADRYSKRPLIGLGYGLAAVGKLMIALASSWQLVLAARSVDRLGKGIRGAPRDVLLMEGADPASRGRIFGFHRMADTLGAVVGPAVGLILYEAFSRQIPPLLWVAVVPAILSVVLVAAVREKRKAPGGVVRGGTGRTTAAPHPGDPARLPARLRLLIGGLTVFSLVNFPDSLLLLRAHDLGLSTEGVIGAYILYNVAYAALSYPAGALSDQIPRYHVFAVGLACFAVGYLGLGLIGDPMWVFPILIVYGGFTAATDGVGKAWVSSLAPAGLQGRAQGLFQGLTGGGILVAGLWAGLAWGDAGRVPLLVSGAAGVVLAVGLVVAGRRLASR
ncbi:MFS transporter [Sinomonas cyclohexanicum]|uniref:MFS transporter n=1 Tax=Sinomonas cyclohexanicum TaxID=322009 RepID=A0ABN6FMC1_SINCY|nr:MFS transporter [Corynebacterium cyclohexanicum]BCT78000.1 MFS transporter [Corynebacterium cyclohexanicum]